MAILSTTVGAVTLARVVNDPKLARGFLDAAARQVRAVAALENPEHIDLGGGQNAPHRHATVKRYGEYEY